MANHGTSTARSTFCVRGGTRGTSSSFEVVASRKLLTVCVIGLFPVEIAALASIVIVASGGGVNTTMYLQGGVFTVRLDQP